MIKRYLSPTVSEEEWPVWRIIVIFVITVIAGIIGALIYFFGPTWSDVAGDTVSPSSSTRIINLEVSGTLLAIPAHYTRYGRDRTSRMPDNVELHALLPNLTGYSDSAKASFEFSSDQSDLLLITIGPIEHKMPPNRLINEVYRPLLIKKGRASTLDTKIGLKRSAFAEGTIYASATFYETTLRVDDTQKSPFYICSIRATGGEWCTGRLRIGNSAQAIYRFSRKHLENWEQINQRLAQKLSQFRADARKEN